MSFLNLSSCVFGLDIGDLSLKIVLLKKRGKRIKLKTYREKTVPDDYFLKGEIKKENELAKFIRDFVKETKISSPYVVAILPETKTFIKMIEITCPKKGDILEEIKKEIELYVPLKIDDVYFDWQEISRKRDRVKILVGLSPKNIVDSYLKVLKMAGLKPVVLEIESLAILRALISKTEGLTKPIIILDLGATRSSLIIVDEGVIQLTISQPFAGITLTKDIASALEIDFKKAEEIKKNYNEEKNQNPLVGKIIFSFLSNLEKVLRDHINFYKESSRKKIEEIILCGGGANLFQLPTFLEKKLKIKVKKGNPWINITDEKIPFSEDISLTYTTAVGLALRGLDEKI